MSWAVPKYSKSKADKAGYALAFPNKQEWNDPVVSPMDVIGNIRSAHGFALNNYQNVLRGIVKRREKRYIIAQRLKRIPSIVDKLCDREGMRLTQVQDIGGCRAIVRSIDVLKDVVNTMKSGRLRDKLIVDDDYVDQPKDDGYRGAHLVFKYKKLSGPSPYDGQRIEVQVRTALQHSWATALETVDMFSRYRLKGGRGPKDWREFFALAGSAFAMMERCPVPDPHIGLEAEIPGRLRQLFEYLDIERRLSGYQAILRSVDRKVRRPGQSGYILIRLNFRKNQLSVAEFSAGEFETANKLYVAAEKESLENRDEEVALVATDNVTELKKAYPNYYMDTIDFFRHLRIAMKEPGRVRGRKAQPGNPGGRLRRR